MLYQGEDAMWVEIAYRQEAARRFAADQRQVALARCCQAGVDLLALARGLVTRLVVARHAGGPPCCAA